MSVTLEDVLTGVIEFLHECTLRYVGAPKTQVDCKCEAFNVGPVTAVSQQLITELSACYQKPERPFQGGFSVTTLLIVALLSLTVGLLLGLLVPHYLVRPVVRTDHHASAELERANAWARSSMVISRGLPDDRDRGGVRSRLG